MIRLADELWKGRRCFIIGGGPSLKKLPRTFFSMLRDELTIGINKAYVFKPTIVFSEDVKFQDWAVKSAEFRRCPSVKVFEHVLPARMSMTWPDIITVGNCGRRWSRTLAEGLVHPTCSGVAALNLAELLGADPIYLLGFDLVETGGETKNWHRGYSWHRGKDSCYGRFRLDFERYAEKIRVRVYNLNPDSALEVFQKTTPESVHPLRKTRWMSYATPNYMEEAEGLLESGKIFGIRPDVHRIKNQGGWKENVRRKPVEILKALEAHPSSGLVYVDADARIIRFPALFDTIPADFAAHLFVRRPGRPGVQVSGGTLYFGPGKASRDLVRGWIRQLKYCQNDPTGDQEALQAALLDALNVRAETLDEWAKEPGQKHAGGQLRFYQLPPEYLWIFDTMPLRYPGRWPTILHRQKSRTVRREEARP